MKRYAKQFTFLDSVQENICICIHVRNIGLIENIFCRTTQKFDRSKSWNRSYETLYVAGVEAVRVGAILQGEGGRYTRVGADHIMELLHTPGGWHIHMDLCSFSGTVDTLLILIFHHYI